MGTQEDTFHLFSRGCEFCTWHLKALPQAIVLGGCPLECPHANAVLQCIKFGHSRVLALNLNLLAVMSVHLPSGTTFSKAYSFSWLNPKKKKILDHFQHPHFPLMNQDSTLSCYPEQAVINWVCFDSWLETKSAFIFTTFYQPVLFNNKHLFLGCWWWLLSAPPP